MQRRGSMRAGSRVAAGSVAGASGPGRRRLLAATGTPRHLSPVTLPAPPPATLRDAPPVGAVPEPAQAVATQAWRLPDAAAPQSRERLLPEETAIALSYNRVSHAVMMGSPLDLEDFALGFSLTEGILEHPGQIEELEVVAAPGGIELRMWIAEGRMAALDRRRRRMAGPTGCGMCGLESLSDAVRPPSQVPRGVALPASAIAAAMAALSPAQALGHATRAVHAAGFWTPGEGLVALREDVGRHNALDKLAGALTRGGVSASGGVVVLTSRVSIELVQKAAVMQAPLLVAVSAPTALAVRVAEAACITLVGVARGDGFEVFTHPWRVVAG